MRVYISGPISGHRNAADLFLKAAAHMEALGHYVVNPFLVPPHTHDGPCPPSYTKDSSHSAACYLRGDLKVLLECDAIFMLPNWEQSIGARLEHTVAVHCGLDLVYGDHDPILKKE
jgi:hypothetical protein